MKKEMKQKQIADILEPSQDGKLAMLRGWIYRIRKQKKMIFLVLRDSTGLIQCIVKSDSKAWKQAEKATTESSIILSGRVKKDPRAPTGYELQVSSFEIVGLADTYPIARDLSEEFLLDVRHLSLRLPKYTAIMRIRSKVFEAAREFLHSKAYVEGTPPMLTKESSEGGSTQFELNYYGEPAKLAQSWQMHGESMILALEKVYCIAPSFRAEKSRTRRHVTEFWHCEVEAAWVQMAEMLKLSEELIVHICKKVSKECKSELKTLGVDATKLSKLKAPFKHMTYEQAVKKIKSKPDKDFGIQEERTLAKDGIVVIISYPKKILKFYHRADPTAPAKGLNFNILFPGVGEVLDGSEREADMKKLVKSAKAQKVKLDGTGFYLDTRKYGAVPHSGFGLGLDRLLMWICETDSIRDVIPFPRTPTRVYP